MDGWYLRQAILREYHALLLLLIGYQYFVIAILTRIRGRLLDQASHQGSQKVEITFSSRLISDWNAIILCEISCWMIGWAPLSSFVASSSSAAAAFGVPVTSSPRLLPPRNLDSLFSSASMRCSIWRYSLINSDLKLMKMKRKGWGVEEPDWNLKTNQLSTQSNRSSLELYAWNKVSFFQTNFKLLSSVNYWNSSTGKQKGFTRLLPLLSTAVWSSFGT